MAGNSGDISKVVGLHRRNTVTQFEQTQRGNGVAAIQIVSVQDQVTLSPPEAPTIIRGTYNHTQGPNHLSSRISRRLKLIQGI